MMIPQKMLIHETYFVGILCSEVRLDQGFTNLSSFKLSEIIILTFHMLGFLSRGILVIFSISSQVHIQEP